MTSPYDKVEILTDSGLIGDRTQWNRRTQTVRWNPAPRRSHSPAAAQAFVLRIDMELEDHGIKQGHLRVHQWTDDGWQLVVAFHDGDPRIEPPKAMPAAGSTVATQVGTYHPNREAVAEWSSQLAELALGEALTILEAHHG